MYKPLASPRNNWVELSSKPHADGEYRNLSWSSTGAELGLGFGLEFFADFYPSSISSSSIIPCESSKHWHIARYTTQRVDRTCWNCQSTAALDQYIIMIIEKMMKVKMVITNHHHHHQHYNYNHWRKKVKEDIWSKVWTIKFRQPYCWLKVATYMYIQWQMAGGYAHTFEAKKKRWIELSGKRTSCTVLCFSQSLNLQQLPRESRLSPSF